MTSAGLIGRRPLSSPADLFDRIRAEGRGEIVTIPVQWPSLHRVIGFGFRFGQISAIAGSPGASKSYMALNIGLYAGKKGFRWCYLPLEDNAERWVEKAMAAHFVDWRMVGNPEEDTDDARRRLADYKETRLASERDLLGNLYEHIRENPRELADDGGDSSPVPYEGVLDWVRRESDEEGTELIIIDPVAQIDFSGRDKDWKQQERFVQALTGIASKGQCHVILVAHIAKRPGRSNMPSSMDDLQGAAAFARLAHNVLLLDRHDPQEADVFSSWNATTEHKLTLSVGKARDGFSGTRIAMDLMQDGPAFREHGIIKPKKAKKGRRNDDGDF